MISHYAASLLFSSFFWRRWIILMTILIDLHFRWIRKNLFFLLHNTLNKKSHYFCNYLYLFSQQNIMFLLYFALPLHCTVTSFWRPERLAAPSFRFTTFYLDLNSHLYFYVQKIHTQFFTVDYILSKSCPFIFYIVRMSYWFFCTITFS